MWRCEQHWLWYAAAQFFLIIHMIFHNWRTSSYPIGLANLLHNFYFNNVIFHNYIFLLLTQKGVCFLSFPLVKVKSGCLCLSISATQLHQLTTSLLTCMLYNIWFFFFFIFWAFIFYTPRTSLSSQTLEKPGKEGSKWQIGFKNALLSSLSIFFGY